MPHFFAPINAASHNTGILSRTRTFPTVMAVAVRGVEMFSGAAKVSIGYSRAVSQCIKVMS
jgi:hypothetical protein